MFAASCHISNKELGGFEKGHLSRTVKVAHRMRGQSKLSVGAAPPRVHFAAVFGDGHGVVQPTRYFVDVSAGEAVHELGSVREKNHVLRFRTHSSGRPIGQITTPQRRQTINRHLVKMLQLTILKPQLPKLITPRRIQKPLLRD